MSFTPVDVVIGFWRWFWVAVMAAVLLAVLVVGGWQAGWWFSNQNISRQFSQTVHSQQYQQALVDQMGQHLANIRGIAVTRSGIPADSPEQVTLRAQELGELSGFCAEAGRLTSQNPATPALMKIVHANCSAGAAVAVPSAANPVPKP